MKTAAKYFALIILLSFGTHEIQAQIPQKSPPTMKLNDPMPANLFVELGRIINPAVVNISTSAIIRGQRGRDPMMELLERFYGFQFQQPTVPNKPQQIGLGTGFIIREDGLIITNNHVIEGADIINVQLTENSEKLYEAKLIGSDQRTDIALIKINPNGKLDTAALGTSSSIQVGEWVAAFGNPYGHGHTLTKGIISSKGREIEELNRVPLLQTDASINPGNSGGPLVDTKGYVIGVNSAIDARAQGIGFAIPIDEVKKILPDLEKRGSIRKGYLGVYLGDHSEASAEELGLKEKNRGAVIINVEKDGPADKAGIKPYDTILEVANKKIKNSQDLSDTISESPVGENVRMKLISSKGKIREVVVKIIERPELKKKKQSTLANKNEKIKKVPFDLGFSVVDIDADLREELQIPNEIKKPIIAAVDRGSIASMAGLRVGDVLVEVNKAEVENSQDVLKNVKKGSNSFKVIRGNQVLIVSVQK